MAEKAKETREVTKSTDEQRQEEALKREEQAMKARRSSEASEEDSGKSVAEMTPEEYANRFRPVQNYLTEQAGSKPEEKKD